MGKQLVLNDDFDSELNEEFWDNEEDKVFLDQSDEVVEWILRGPKVGDYFMGVKRIG